MQNMRSSSRGRASSKKVCPTLHSAYLQYANDRLGKLRPKTQANYERAAKLISITSRKNVAAYVPQDIEDLIIHLAPGAYMVARGFFSVLFGYAIEKGWRSENPVQHVPTRQLGRIKRIPRAHVPILTELLPEPSRTVLEAMYESGQRMGDILKLTLKNIRPKTDWPGSVNMLTLVQEKTGNPVSLPISDSLTQKLLALVTRWDDKLFHGVSAAAVRRDVRRVRKGLGAYTPHGLRKSASCEAAEGGATEAQLQALLGHKTPRMAAEYRLEADQGRLAAAAQECRREQ